jgi:hypothetical protein
MKIKRLATLHDAPCSEREKKMMKFASILVAVVDFYFPNQLKKMTKNNPFFLGWQIQNHRQKRRNFCAAEAKATN